MLGTHECATQSLGWLAEHMLPMSQGKNLGPPSVLPPACDTAARPFLKKGDQPSCFTNYFSQLLTEDVQRGLPLVCPGPLAGF